LVLAVYALAEVMLMILPAILREIMSFGDRAA
jgi:hypothetical protein